MSLALSLCQQVSRPRRGLGQASPSLEAPRLQALDSFINILEGKDYHHEDKQGKEASFGSFLAPETDMILESELRPPLFEALVANSVLVCVSRSFFRVGLKPDLQGGTGFNLLRAQFWTPCKGNVFKKGSESGPLEIKSGPPGGSRFGPFIVANLLKCFFQVEVDFTSNSCGWNLELGRPIFARLLFVTF